MKYHTLGKTDLRISPIGMGGNIFGYLLDEYQTIKMLDCALDLGINFIDTADVYSGGLSETFVSKATSKCRHKWIIASKAGLNKGEDVAGIGKKEKIREKVENSLKRLNTDYIDLYQLHHFDPVTPLDESLSAFDELVYEGKIRYSGCSNFNFEQMKVSFSIANSLKSNGFSSIQMPYNLLKRNIEKDILPFCRAHKMGVIVYGAIGRGILSDKYLKINNCTTDYITRAHLSDGIRNDLTPKIQDLLQNLNKYAHEKLGTNLQTMAISWIHHQKAVSSVLLGMRSTIQLKDNLKALELVLNGENLNAIDELIGDLSMFHSLSLGDFIS